MSCRHDFNDIEGDFGRRKRRDDVLGDFGRRRRCDCVFECLFDLLDDALEDDFGRCPR
ncbi:MAG: hypothetical protein GX289_03570 [Tissierellia bacterium]|nr:hypothetical protein [Tissierellia bacterium]